MKHASFCPDLDSFRMQEFRLPLIWEMAAEVTVYAISQDDALNFLMENIKTLPEGVYLDGSLRVDDDVLADL